MVAEVPDEQLVRAAQRGDREAFLALYNRYFNKVYYRVRSRVPPGEVDDVVQEIFFAMARSLERFRHQSRFNTWLYTIANRQIADFYRRRERKNPEPVLSLEDVTHGEPSYEHNNLDDQAALQRALNAVPDHYREVVLMRFADGLSFAEIAAARNQSLEATKSLYRRAIQALRDLTDEDDL